MGRPYSYATADEIALAIVMACRVTGDDPLRVARRVPLDDPSLPAPGRSALDQRKNGK